MKQEITEKLALQKIARSCSLKEYCISDVKEKLIAWNLNEEEVERILVFLLKEKYIDESRYCEAFVHDKLHHNKWGRIKISHFLHQKKIPAKTIDIFLDKIDREVYKSILQRILISRKAGIKAQNEFDLKNKLYRFALSRGFESEIIGECLNSLKDND